MRQALIYSLKVWLTTLIVAPLLSVLINWSIALYNPITYYVSSGFWIDVYFDFLAGAALLPLAVLFWLATLFLIKTPSRLPIIKLLLTLVAIILCAVPFVISGQTNQLSLEAILSTSYWLPAYLIVAVLCIWLYRLKPSNERVAIINV